MSNKQVPPRKVEPEHPLSGQRSSTALTFAGLGGTFGIGLMIGRVLAPVGLAISLLSAALIVWLYIKPFRLAYQALRTQGRFRGNAQELFLAAGLVVLIVGLAVPVFIVVTAQEFNPNRARYTYETIVPVKEPGKSVSYFNLSIKNAGTLSANHQYTTVAGKFAEGGAITDADIEVAYKELYSRLKTGRQFDHSTVQVQPSNSVVVTIPGVLLSDQDWGRVTDGQALLYFFIAILYDDELLASAGYTWLFEQCGYYVLTTSYYHNCGSHNAITKIKNTEVDALLTPNTETKAPKETDLDLTGALP